MRVIAVGVSPDRSSAGRGVPFAASDARRFTRDSEPRAIAICDDAATRDAIRETIDRIANGEAQEPCLIVLIAETSPMDGHLLVELADGPVDLAPLLAPLWNSDLPEVIVAVDLSRGFDHPPAGWDAGLAAVIEELAIRPGRVLLLSDDGGQASHISGELQAGIWTFHLANAFSGDDLQARDADGRLTAGSLRAYLEQEVEDSLRHAFSDQRRQRPLVLASDDDEVLAKPPRAAAATPLAAHTRGLELRGGRSIPVKQLGGFRKSLHRPPADALDSSREWVRRLAEPDLRRELEETTTRLREKLGLKRRQLRASGPTQGGASILTPDFAIHFAIEQSEEQPTVARLQRTLTEIRDIECLGRPSLADVFPQGFSQLYQPFETRADLEALIDTLEDDHLPQIAKIDYPTDLSYCELTLTGSAGQVRIEPAGLTIGSDSPVSPADLVRRYALVRELLG